MTKLSKPLQDNLRFLCVEIDSQVTSLQHYLTTPSAPIASSIIDRSGYAYNLKTRIHSTCLDGLSNRKEGDTETLMLRSMEFIATNLERIAELCREGIKQISYLDSLKNLEVDKYTRMLKRVRGGIALIQPAIEANNTRLALKLAQIEDKLDDDYNKLQKYYITALKQKKHTEDYTCALFLARIIEQMGDALLDISESIISANLGQPLNFERYNSLQATVERLNSKKNFSKVRIEPIAETRSGSAISGVTHPKRKSDNYLAIFKEGKKHKLKEERQGMESWHEIYPGLAPKILSYKKRGESAALLIEHLPGLTFEQILLNESPKLLNETLGQLGRTLRSIWRETYIERPVAANFMKQLEKRLPDVYKIHPEFQHDNARICDLEILSFRTLIQEAKKLEETIKAPFSVYIHGDFNVDNIIYDPMTKRINFIDLHRSRYMDYVQDISVFMVSNFRLQILDAPLRRRILQLAQDFCRNSRRYAHKAGDETFELRLALGLARSFATSARFILDKSLAQNMFLRARYLIELALATDPKHPSDFVVPVKEIFVG